MCVYCVDKQVRDKSQMEPDHGHGQTCEMSDYSLAMLAIVDTNYGTAVLQFKFICLHANFLLHGKHVFIFLNLLTKIINLGAHAMCA